MIYIGGSLLIARPDTPQNLQAIKEHIALKNLTQDDVKIIRADGLLKLIAKRDVKYGNR